MTVTIYRSTDASAPVLTGQVGSLITLLTAVLSTGYGSQPGAGWTVPFTGTNGAVYKQGSGSGFYMLINDNGPGAGTAKEARIFPSEACTAYSATAASSTNLFPTTAQQANGLFLRKSATADATARPWIIVADNRTVYVFVQTGDSGTAYYAWWFGDYASLLSGDPYACGVTARATENSASAAVDFLDTTCNMGVNRTATYQARGYTGTGGAAAFSVFAWNGRVGSVSTYTGMNSASNQPFYPNPPDGAVYVSPVCISDSNASQLCFRGYFRGFWQFVHNTGVVVNGDTFVVASGPLAGKTFLVISPSANSATYLIEVSNTWP